MKKHYFILVFIFTIISCDKPVLNGHYHVEWDNRTSFQTWNIKNNRMRINDSVCSDKKQICYGMPIEFKGDSIFIPWVDIEYAAKYKINDNGTIITTTNYNNSIDTLMLFPKQNCIDSKDYLNNKVSILRSNFNLVSLYYNTHGKSALPKDFKNELIIGLKEEKPYFIMNGKVLNFTNQSYNVLKPLKPEDIWIYVDSKIKLNQVLPILKELKDKRYNIYFTSKDERENNEQVIIFKKSITNIKINKEATLIKTCEYCEKHPNYKIDSILEFKIFKKDSCLVNNEYTDYFQLRNYASRYIRQNRTTRLNNEIQLEINSNILFEDYLYLLGDIEFLNKDLSSISYYYGKEDPDQKQILEKQNSLEPNQLQLEFPLRIKEIIYPF